MKEIESMTEIIKKEDSFLQVPTLKEPNTNLNDGRSQSSFFVLKNKEPPKKLSNSGNIKPISSLQHINGLIDANSQNSNENGNSLLVPSRNSNEST